MSRASIALFAGHAVAAAALDLVSKAWAFRVIPRGGSIGVVDGLFYLRTSCNTGGVFGMMKGHVSFFVVFSLIAVGVILWVFWKQGAQDLRLSAGLGLLLGGAIGNLHDRIMLQQVRDFLDFRIGRWAWPTFNIADAAITVGVGLVLLASFLAPDPGQGSGSGEVAKGDAEPVP